LEWRRCLEQVQERNGALEIAVVRKKDAEGGLASHLVWRVRLLQLTDREIIVEQPTALGEVIRLEPGIDLVAILAIGQNRWMFMTRNLGPAAPRAGAGRLPAAIRLSMPESVERCQRRNYYRMETAAIRLPEVEMWPLLDPQSVLPAERANELAFQEDRDGRPRAGGPAAGDNDMVMPEVGPKFTATLINIGGGGIGLRVRQQDAQVFGHHRLFWVRFVLPPELKTPICATAKVAHTSVDSTQHTYAGMAFDFSFNPLHQRFVVEQICRYINLQQRAQLADRGAA
jgi:hypothetical protein